MLWISVNSHGLVIDINCSYKWELHVVSLNVCLHVSVHPVLFHIKLLLLLSCRLIVCTTSVADPPSSRTQPGPSGNAFMPTNQIQGPTNSQPTYPSATVNSPMPNPVPPASAYPMTQPAPTPVPRIAPAGGAVALRSEDYTKAMKYCKFASSALQYEDAKTAIDNLTKALNLLTSGRE